MCRKIGQRLLHVSWPPWSARAPTGVRSAELVEWNWGEVADWFEPWGRGVASAGRGVDQCPRLRSARDRLGGAPSHLRSEVGWGDGGARRNLLGNDPDGFVK